MKKVIFLFLYFLSYVSLAQGPSESFVFHSKLFFDMPPQQVVKNYTFYSYQFSDVDALPGKELFTDVDRKPFLFNPMENVRADDEKIYITMGGEVNPTELISLHIVSKKNEVMHLLIRVDRRYGFESEMDINYVSFTEGMYYLDHCNIDSPYYVPNIFGYTDKKLVMENYQVSYRKMKQLIRKYHCYLQK